MVGNNLGFLRAAFDAVAATDAPVVDDFSVIAMNANCLDRAVADAGITLSTVFLDCDDLAHAVP